jgi:predicted dehydrogenase
MQKQTGLSRRALLAGATAAAVFTIVPRHVLGGPRHVAPSEKLNIAMIGVGAQGSHLMGTVPSENMVALCDVDQTRLALAAKTFPNAKTYSDFRKMLETQKDIDAVMIAAPDHLHAQITIAAIKLSKHVYCEKPLTHSVWEARQIAAAAREARVATQMGNAGQAKESARQLRELFASGEIGNIREIHAWSNRNPDICPRGQARPKETPPVPATLDWDLWLGPALQRPYHPAYCPWNWRGWWDFGTGVLGDIGCHQLSTAFKALHLEHPADVEACSTNWQHPDVRDESAPLASMVRYNFAASGDRPAVQINWYDGGMRPPRPEILEADKKFGNDDGILYVGEKGMVLNFDLIPESRMKSFNRPAPTLPRSPGHQQEWLNAAKGGEPAGSNFVDHAAHLTEVVLLGNVAIRTNSKLTWDPQAMKFTNAPEADAFLNPPRRAGWNLV